LLGEEVVKLVREWLQVEGEKEEKETPGIQLRTRNELLNMQFPEPTWLVPKLIPEGGLVLFTGKPKIGKSWLALDIACGLADASSVAGIKIDKAKNTLYLALEDTEARLKDRLEIAGFREGGGTFGTEWPRINAGGKELLERVIDKYKFEAVIIDPLARIKTRAKKEGNPYELDYEDLGALKSIADKKGITIIVLHHLKKGDIDEMNPLESILGTTGIIGVADTILVLRRNRTEADGTLYVVSRNAGEQELAMKFEAGRWKVLGNAREFAISQEQRKIVEAIKTLGENARPKEIARLLEKNQNTVRVTLKKMLALGLLNVVDGVYKVVEFESID
jgi:hypothetical protein